MSEYLFGLHSGHLTAVADQIAGRARHVNYKGARGESCGWFACPNGGSQFAVAKAVVADIDRAGGVETLRRSRNARETSSARSNYADV